MAAGRRVASTAWLAKSITRIDRSGKPAGEESPSVDRAIENQTVKLERALEVQTKALMPKEPVRRLGPAYMGGPDR